MDFSLDVHPQSEETTLRVSGEFDGASAIVFAESIEANVAGRHGHVWNVDLTGVDFIDSSGLRALMAAWELVGKGPNEMRLITNAVVDRVLEISGLTDHFDVGI